MQRCSEIDHVSQHNTIFYNGMAVVADKEVLQAVRVSEAAPPVESKCSRIFTSTHKHIRAFAPVACAHMLHHQASVALPLIPGAVARFFISKTPLPSSVTTHTHFGRPRGVIQHKKLSTRKITVNHVFLLVPQDRRSRKSFLFSLTVTIETCIAGSTNVAARAEQRRTALHEKRAGASAPALWYLHDFSGQCGYMPPSMSISSLESSLSRSSMMSRRSCSLPTPLM